MQLIGEESACRKMTSEEVPINWRSSQSVETSLLCAVGQSPGDSYVDMSIAFQRLTHASLVNQRLSSAGSCILGYLTTGSFGNSSIKSVLASDLSIPFLPYLC